MDFEKLRTFFHVASLGSVGEAVKSLKIDKSSISRQIAQLEDQVGAKLFDRNRQKLLLTHQGRILHKRAANILMEVDAAKAAIASKKSLPAGTLTISTTFAIASTWLTHFIDRFIDKYQDIKLCIRATNEPLNLSLREADVAIRPYCNDADDLIQKHLMQWTLKLYASQSYIDRYGIPKTMEELDDHRLIVFGEKAHIYPYSYSNWPLTIGTKNGKYRKSYLVINSVEGMFNLVSRGIGIGNFATDSPLTKNKLIPILSDTVFQNIDVYYIYPKQLQNVEPVLALEEFLLDYVKEVKRPKEKHDIPS